MISWNGFRKKTINGKHKQKTIVWAIKEIKNNEYKLQWKSFNELIWASVWFNNINYSDEKSKGMRKHLAMTKIKRFLINDSHIHSYTARIKSRGKIIWKKSLMDTKNILNIAWKYSMSYKKWYMEVGDHKEANKKVMRRKINS